MPEHVQAEQADVVLDPQSPERHVLESPALRALEELALGAVVEAPPPSVEVDGTAPSCEVQGDHGSGRGILPAEKEVEVRVGPQPLLGVETSHGPPLDEDGIQSRRLEGPERLEDPAAMDRGLEGVQPVSPTEPRLLGHFREGRSAEAPPREARRPGGEQQRRGREEGVAGELEGRRRGTPSPGEDAGHHAPPLHRRRHAASFTSKWCCR